MDLLPQCAFSMWGVQAIQAKNWATPTPSQVDAWQTPTTSRLRVPSSILDNLGSVRGGDMEEQADHITEVGGLLTTLHVNSGRCKGRHEEHWHVRAPVSGIWKFRSSVPCGWRMARVHLRVAMLACFQSYQDPSPRALKLFISKKSAELEAAAMNRVPLLL